MKPQPNRRLFFLLPTRIPYGRRSLLCGLLLSILLLSTGCTLPLEFILNAQEGATPGEATALPNPIISIAPETTTPGATIAVAGAGWQAQDVITLKLASSEGATALEESFGVATVNADGAFAAAITFPTDDRWLVFSTVVVIAESGESGARVSAPLQVTLPGTVTPATTITGTTTGTTVATFTPTAASSTATPIAAATATATPVAATATTAAPTQPAAPTATPVPLGPDQAFITSRALNVRSGPSTAYAIVTAVRYGAIVTVRGQNSSGTWLLVQLNNGTSGWVASNYTSFQGTAPVVQPSITPVATRTAVSPTSVPVTSVPITDWRGEYFANRSLSGSPAFVRNDVSIDFNWGSGSPAAGIANDNFSVRWTRSVSFDSGTYRFHVRVDDGARLFVDDQLIIDQWQNGSEREFTADRYLNDGSSTLRLEYFEETGGARAALWWERISSDNNDDDDEDFPDWKGEYYDNRELDDDPSFRRNDDEINFNWGGGSPDSRIDDDNFSVRWTRRVDFRDGRYRFNIRADDGVRFFIDGNRVLDEWHENDYNNGYTREFDLRGGHELKVEYYERRGGARVRFSWDRIGDIVTATPVPPTATPTTVAPVTPTHTPLPPTATPTNTALPTVTPTVIQPSANVQPATGGPGTSVTINGGGFPANTTVNVHLGALVGVRSSAVDPTTYASTTTDRTGSYSVQFNLPTNWPDGEPISTGQLLIMVATADFGAQATTILNYTVAAPTPTATLTNTPVATATEVPGATATNTPVPPTATPTSAVTATPVPQPFVNVQPGAATPGTLLTVTGGGYPANVTVSAYLGIFDGEVGPNDAAVPYGSTVTDGNGNFTITFVMPETTPGGALLGSGRVAIVVATNGFGLQAATTIDFTGTAPTATPTVAAAANATAAPVEEAAD